MSNQQNNNQQKTHIINPLTQRYIKIGSRSYIRLCKDGVIKPDELLKDNDKILFQVRDDNLSEEQVKLKLDTAKEFIDAGKYNILKKGKGVYKNSLVKKKKTLNHEQVKNFTLNIMKNQEIQKLYDSETEYDSDDIERMINDVINNELK